jgi:macrodomain Ter protein organizer (MatP/YcbG family)
VTTLKIEESVRDRLRALAQRYGRTMGEQVAAMVDQAEQAEMWRGYRDAMASLNEATRAEIAVHASYALRSATEEHRRAAAR